MCRLLAGIAPDSLARGNRVSWLASGSDFFQAAALAIEGSRTFVHFEVYIFRPDATGLRLLELLTAAARRGVEVRLLYDSFGSFSLKSRHLAPLREAGGKAEVLERAHPLLRHLGKTITHVGGHGAGQVAKACNQIVQVVNIQGIAEIPLNDVRAGWASTLPALFG